MKNNDNSLNVRKRLMFSKDDDYYFITYNIIIILNTIGCTDINTKLTDYTKLGYLLPFISNINLIDRFIKYRNEIRKPSNEDLEFLQHTYLKSRLKLKMITSILFALEQNDLVSLIKNSKRHSIDIWLNKGNIPSEFISSNLFEIEISNINRLKKEIPQLKRINTKTLIDRLYNDCGVKVWEH